MNKLICAFNEQYESLVDSISQVDNEFIVRTVDARFFRLSEASARLLNILEAQTDNNKTDTPPELKLFLEQVLLDKGIYRSKGSSRRFQAKQPSLFSHYELFSALFTNKLTLAFTWLFNPFVLFLMLATMLSVNYVFFSNHLHFFSYDYFLTYSASEVLLLFLLSIVASVLHELGHASCCKYLAGKTGGIGIGVNFFIPVFYANVTDIHTLPAAKKPLVALSGIYLQMIFATGIIFLSPVLPEVNKYLLFNLFAITFNLIPFFRNDGYWFLNDSLRKEDLLKETLHKLIHLDNVRLIHILYGLLLAIFFFAVTAFVVNFAFYRGPQMLTEVFAEPDFDFSAMFKAGLIALHYIVIITSCLFCFKLLRQNLNYQHNT